MFKINKDVIGKISSWLQFLFILGLVFYAGYLKGYHERASEIQKRASQWIYDNCENLSQTCYTQKHPVIFWNPVNISIPKETK